MNAELPKPAHAQCCFLDKLLAIGSCVFDFMKPIEAVLHDDIFPSPLLEAWIVQINNGANGEDHNS